MLREYAALLGVDLCFQSFEAELEGLPGKYAPPNGALLIALHQDEAAGCVALRDLGDGVCEMKRLFVRPQFRKFGLGRQLADTIIAKADQLGYLLMRLDTLDRLSEAMRLYERLGFRKIPAYYDNPLAGVVYWELDLGKRQRGQQSAPPLPH
jgi:GNAT superfamily N-acetyltransferase